MGAIRALRWFAVKGSWRDGGGTGRRAAIRVMVGWASPERWPADRSVRVVTPSTVRNRLRKQGSTRRSMRHAQAKAGTAEGRGARQHAPREAPCVFCAALRANSAPLRVEPCSLRHEPQRSTQKKLPGEARTACQTNGVVLLLLSVAIQEGHSRAMMNVSASQPPSSDSDRRICNAAGDRAALAAMPESSIRHMVPRHHTAGRRPRAASWLAAFPAICSGWVPLDAR